MCACAGEGRAAEGQLKDELIPVWSSRVKGRAAKISRLSKSLATNLVVDDIVVFLFYFFR